MPPLETILSANRHCARPHAYTPSVGVYLQRITGLNTQCRSNVAWHYANIFTGQYHKSLNLTVISALEKIIWKAWIYWFVQGGEKSSPSSSTHWGGTRTTTTMGYSSHSSSSTRGTWRTAKEIKEQGMKWGTVLCLNHIFQTGVKMAKKVSEKNTLFLKCIFTN